MCKEACPHAEEVCVQCLVDEYASLMLSVKKEHKKCVKLLKKLMYEGQIIELQNEDYLKDGFLVSKKSGVIFINYGKSKNAYWNEKATIFSTLVEKKRALPVLKLAIKNLGTIFEKENKNLKKILGEN